MKLQELLQLMICGDDTEAHKCCSTRKKWSTTANKFCCNAPATTRLLRNWKQWLDSFLYNSSLGGPPKIIIFSSQQPVPFLSSSAPWFGEGTFKVCSDSFSRCILCMQNKEGVFFHAHLRFFQVKQKPLTQDSFGNFLIKWAAIIPRTYYWSLKKLRWMLLRTSNHKLK